MRTDIHLHIHFDGREEVIRRIDVIEDKVDLILDRSEKQMSQMDDLKAAVARETTVVQSGITLLQGVSQQLKDALAANDPQAITDVIAQLDASAQAMADAIAANTPAATA